MNFFFNFLFLSNFKKFNNKISPNKTSYFFFFFNNKNYLKKKKNTFLNINSFKFYKLFFTFSKDFYSLFSTFNLENISSKNYSYFLEINSSLKNNNYLNNYYFLNSWYMNFFSYLFYLKLSKKKKSSSDGIFNLEKKIVILNHKKRQFFFLKILKNYYFLKNTSFSKFYIFIMFDTFLNLKNSYLYKNKISLYKKLLSN